ncbi:MAG: HD domain-containing protein [Chloroflexi bacterium]|nr:HD domain-containing protein [Chloroflexota bacterium]
MTLTPQTPRRPLIWHDCVQHLQKIVPADQEVYIVGGAVRDAFLHLPLHDLDLATPGDGRPLARMIANQCGGDYYSLDPERGIGRALISWNDTRLSVDVAQFRGPDLLSDLVHRDFTVNAMAVQLTGDLQQVIDPLGGLNDLQARLLRQCHPNSIADDPVRALRAIRTSVSHHLLIEPVTRQSLKDQAHGLQDASIERVRDEFFHILNSPKPAAALAALQHLGLLRYIIPEAENMQGVEQSAPHVFDLWKHTLAAVEALDTIQHLCQSSVSPDLTANLQFGMIVSTIHAVREPLREHLSHEWPNGRTHHALLNLAALLHDVGKPATRSVSDEGKLRFWRHEQVGERIALERAAALRLSNDEIARLTTIIRNHMRPHWLNADSPITARSIYRFWRDTGAAGVDVCLLAMADYLATSGVTLETRAWVGYLANIQILLERYYLHRDKAVPGAALLNGQQLLEYFRLEPGPLIGELLENLREAQAVGDISNTQEALEWVQRFLNNNHSNS